MKYESFITYHSKVTPNGKVFCGLRQTMQKKYAPKLSIREIKTADQYKSNMAQLFLS